MPEKIVFVNKLPTPYMDQFLARLASDDRVHLDVHHLWKGTADRPWEVELGIGYSNRYMKPRFGLIDLTLTHRAVAEKHALFFVNDWGHIVSLIVIFVRGFLGHPVVIWTDVPKVRSRDGLFHHFLRRRILRRVFACVDGIAATGSPAIDVLIEMGAPEEKLINLPYPVDPAVQCHRESKGANLSLLYVGQLVPRKGVDTVLCALAHAVNVLGSEATLTVVGDGDQAADLRSLASSLEIAHRVTWTGWLEPEAVVEQYASADAYIHLARWEPYGVAVLDALAYGLPVIGTDVTGAIADRVDHEITGFVVALGDAHAAATAIRVTEMMADEDYSRMSRAALAESARWSIARVVDEVVAMAARIAK